MIYQDMEEVWSLKIKEECFSKTSYAKSSEINTLGSKDW